MFTEDTVYTPGAGLEGPVDSTLYRLGNTTFVGELADGVAPQTQDALHSRKREGAATAVYLGSAGKWLARSDLANTLRPEARDVIAHFQKMGKTIVLLSGDGQKTVAHVESQLQIADPYAYVYGGRTPEQKLAFVRDLQAPGVVVAMVGDGINDVALLNRADVSFSMGSGAALAQIYADAVLLSNHLSPMCEASAIAVNTMNVIRQNLAWASLLP